VNRGFFRGLVDRPVAVTMVFIAIVVFGFVSWSRLPIELMPDISYPTLTVRTDYPGAAPQEVETQISEPLEQALATLDGLVSLESRSRAGTSDVVLGFDWGTDMSASAQRVREALQTTFLTDGADRPLVLRYDPSMDPFLRLALAWDAAAAPENADAALFQLREIAEDELKRTMESMPGVAAVQVRGGLEREIRIELQEDWLAARKLTISDVANTLAAENLNMAGGSILEGDTEYLVRTLSEYQSLQDLNEIDIRRSDGTLVPLRDVATIFPTHKEREIITHLDQGEAVELEIFKEADANVVEVAALIKSTLDQPQGDKPSLRGSLPEGMRLEVLDDQAEFINSAIGNLSTSVLFGGFFAVAVLFLFLKNFRATAIIGLAIPISVIVGFAPLYLWGVSLNLMSLGGLALGVGMLVDNAVVVLESIQRYREEGLDVRESAAQGVSAVASAVIASTLTTVAVFAPIAFVEGVAGELFGDLSLAVVGSLLASLAVALFLVPTLAGLRPDEDTGDDDLELLAWLRPGAENRPSVVSVVVKPIAAEAKAYWSGSVVRRVLTAPWTAAKLAMMFLTRVFAVLFIAGATLLAFLWMKLISPLIGFTARVLTRAADAFQSVFVRLENWYSVVIGRQIRRPGTVVSAGMASLLLAVALVNIIGVELLPEVHQGRFTVSTAMPVGTPLAINSRVVTSVEQNIAAHPDVQTVYSTIGTDGRADADSDEGPNTARVRVQLTPGGNLKDREEAVMADLRAMLDNVPKLNSTMERPSLFSFKTPIELVVMDNSLDVLARTNNTLTSRVADIEGLSDVRSSLSAGNPEIRIKYDRARLFHYGLDTNTAASSVRDKIQGKEATRLRAGEQNIDMLVRLAEDERGSLEDLRRLNVNPNLYPVIPLAAVAELEEGVGPSEIRRIDQRRAVVISATPTGYDLATASEAVREVAQSTAMDRNSTWELRGQSEDMKESMASLQFALLLAVFLVYVIMASTFESLLHPFVILFSVPLAFVGVAASLWLTGLSLSVVAFIGMIVLAGVVVNNAIVLVDAINQLRDEGMERLSAVQEAARTRLRPILITTATTVLGLLPLSLGYGAGAEIQQPLAVTVIGGLSTATLLTLVVVPAAYTLMTGGARKAEA